MRLFNEHYIRKVISLDGAWDFAADCECMGEAEEWYKNFPVNSIKVTVPSCVNNRLGYMDFQSVCWYKKDFYTHGGAINIKFFGVTEYAKVYLDGKFVGDHYGSFTAFDFDCVVNEGTHTLICMTDSRSTADTIPQWEVDWYHYCGIIRSVQISEFSAVAIKNFRVDYTLDEKLENADVCVKVKLKNFYDDIAKNIKIDIDGKNIFDEQVTVKGECEIEAAAALHNIKLWDVENPNLSTVRVYTDDDDLIDKIGFRKIETCGKKILLNGKPIKFLGINRHESHPEWGFAMPAALNERDMDILKDLGVNAVRGSHYPNTQFFVDMCDANGILFWSEIPMWGFKSETLQRPLVAERGLAMHTEMIEQYCNHPSIIIWGLHNEIATDTKEGYEITKLFADKIRELDGSRLITYATNRALSDICLEFADIICINRYIGWYDGKLNEWQKFVDDVKLYFEKCGVADKPIVMSEFGVGAVYGTRGFDELKWSENYQVEFYKHTLDLFLNDDDMSGVYLWQFCDIRSNAQWSLLRARSFNNKGLLNEHRQPKLAYYAVKEIFENERNKAGNS